MKLEEPQSRKRQSAPSTPRSNGAKRIKTEIKTEPDSPSTLKVEDEASSLKKLPVDKAAALQARKLKAFTSYSKKSPFPTFSHPTPSECTLAHRILASLHGDRSRPETIVAPKDSAGCGNSPSVLDALVRTILSQNTSDANSSRAKRSMDAAYGEGHGPERWAAVVKGGQPKLERTIQTGGLAAVKSRAIMSILEQAEQRYGTYSLDHLFDASDDDAMREMLAFKGVGPKTASCVLLFCLRRASFAVDTHVYRITGLLGWRPAGATREEAQAHLDVMVPDEEKYALHVLLISHGKNCEECKAGGKSVGKCELRKAFRKGALKGEAGEEVKEETEEKIKDEIKTED